VDLEGGYGGASGKLWQADGWIEPLEHRGNIAFKADRFTFDRIGRVLEGSMVLDYDKTSIDAEVELGFERGHADVTGAISLSGLTIHHAAISEEPMRNISFDGEMTASFDGAARSIEFTSSVTTKGVEYQLSGGVAMPGGRDPDGARRSFPRMNLHLVIPETGCQDVLDSIPAEFVPRLQGFKLKGKFYTDLTFAADWEDIKEKTVLEGGVGLFNCKVKEPREEFDAERLMETFEHQILVGPDEWEEVTIGMESDNYTQIFDISPYLLNAIMTTEDSAFYKHKGFIVREFKTALIKNLEAGYFKYGASSITMQMVKNVFLYREKTLSRKVQELFLTWYVEQVLDKNRILEIYVNAIEYGPGIYGITKAASLYFDKHPRELNPVEAAYFSYLLPAPRRRYFQWCRDKLSRGGKNKIARVLKLMLKRERLTQEEYDEAVETPIEFNPVKVKELCKKPPEW
jgi:hypothetical protein